MNITLNIGLEVSKHYLPEGVEEMKLQYEHVKAYLEIIIGAPMQITLAQSATEKKTVGVSYIDAEAVLPKLFSLARTLKQDCIAYSVQDGGTVLGGALVGEYAHEWNSGIFDSLYFISQP